jgi:hypothetical protein
MLNVTIENIGDLAVVECEGRLVARPVRTTLCRPRHPAKARPIKPLPPTCLTRLRGGAGYERGGDEMN